MLAVVEAMVPVMVLELELELELVLVLVLGVQVGVSMVMGQLVIRCQTHVAPMLSSSPGARWALAKSSTSDSSSTRVCGLDCS